MRRALQALFLAVPMLIIAAAAIVPMPLQWSMGGMIFGLLLFQLALVGSFESLLPNARIYLDLRHETDRLLELVRELNAAAVDARKVGLDPGEYTDPIIERMHETVDRLPAFAGRPSDGHVQYTQLSGPGFQEDHEVH